MRNGRGYASECLPNAKEEIEVTGSLRNELSRGGLSVHLVCHRLETGKCGRIQIVTEIQANGTDRSLVMHPHSDRVRHVVKVALGIGALVETEVGILLSPAEQIVHHIGRLGKYVAHIVEQREAEVIPDIGQVRGRETPFELVQEQGTPPQGKTGLQIARSCLVKPETTVRVASAREKTFGQGDEAGARGRGF